MMTPLKLLSDALERVQLDPAVASLPSIEQARKAAALLLAESAPVAVYAEGEPVKISCNAKVFRLNPNDPETFGSVNPGIEALKKLEARQVAMLDQPELELLREFMDHGRTQGVLVEFDTDTDVQGWAEMNSLGALEVLALANSYVRLRFS
ncbi:hypothetical protein [Serratia proteamaculans]|uniref:hypothetical protein n=1 Tax=Serratia proteamaculans TaxID=28151 RepID=UPI003D063487